MAKKGWGLPEALKSKNLEAIWPYLEKMRPSIEEKAVQAGFQDPEFIADGVLIWALEETPKVNWAPIRNPYGYLFKMVVRELGHQKVPLEEHTFTPPSGREYFRPKTSRYSPGESLREQLAWVDGNINPKGEGPLGWRGFVVVEAPDFYPPDEHPRYPLLRTLLHYFTPSYGDIINPEFELRHKLLKQQLRKALRQIDSIVGEVARRRMVKYCQGYSLTEITKEEPPNPQTGRPITKVAIWNSIERYLDAWGWKGREQIYRIRYFCLFAALLDIRDSIEPLYDHIGPNRTRVVSAHYLSQLHTKVTTDPRTRAWFGKLPIDDTPTLVRLIEKIEGVFVRG